MDEETSNKLKTMKLFGMLRAFQTSMESDKLSNLTADEMIACLVDEEWDDRYNRKIARTMKNAKFRYKASMEEIYFDAKRSMDKNQVMRLADCNFIRKKENLLITGSTGIGKSYLASALGQQACTQGYRVLYVNT